MICCFLKFIFWVVAYHVIALNYWPATGHVSISFGFTQTEWFRPPHWSRAVVYESINHSTEDTICFSLWDRETLVCETESKLAFVASVCERNYKEKKTNQMVNFCIFGLLFWFCLYNCFGASLSKKSGRKQRRGMKGEVFFLFSFFFYFILLSVSPTFAQKLDRKLLRRRLSRN